MKDREPSETRTSTTAQAAHQHGDIGAKQERQMNRAELGVDGNCGFALLGPDLQEGTTEFEEFSGDIQTSEGTRQAKLAINRAYQRLKARIGRPISYYLGSSHPDCI